MDRFMAFIYRLAQREVLAVLPGFERGAIK